MLNPTYQVERPAAAGSPRALAFDAAVSDVACGVVHTGAFGIVDRGWTIPSAMPVSAAKHGSTPAPRPEEAVPR